MGQSILRRRDVFVNTPIVDQDSKPSVSVKQLRRTAMEFNKQRQEDCICMKQFGATSKKRGYGREHWQHLWGRVVWSKCSYTLAFRRGIAMAVVICRAPR